MPEFIISGIPVNFPFTPYKVQMDYMEKVIECLNKSTNAVLESPTGTGKTLSLLCSTLGWVLMKKAEFQAHKLTLTKNEQMEDFIKNLNAISSYNQKEGAGSSAGDYGVPTVIYASRTHSQLSQAIQELKNSAYNHVKATVIGSRDQLCIHPDVMNEINNSAKISMCKLKVVTKTCTFYNNVERKREQNEFKNARIIDIEDIVVLGRKHKVCPYFMSKELSQNAEIIFMPYNYLLDPKARRANKIELSNTIIIIDEAHNVEKMCEESASIKIKSSEIAVCIEDITGMMKAIESDTSFGQDENNQRDFTIDDLALLKEMFLNLEKTIDDIVIHNAAEGVTFQGTYIFELLGKANVNTTNHLVVEKLLNDILQYLSVASEKRSIPKGTGIQVFTDLITIAFANKESNYLQKVDKCFKVHVDFEEAAAPTMWGTSKSSSKTSTKTNKAKIINYWCFSPAFGMNDLLQKNVRSIIFTSGTLAPLSALISELGIDVPVRLENPHIVNSSQVFVKIVSEGPDREQLNSSYANRDNPKYIASLGRTVLSLCPVVPHGVLIFFPSYPLLSKCQDAWQTSGMWSQITKLKPIYVEPRNKNAFLKAMEEYYADINDPITKGAIFMAVCRGKVSEGLDFADANGRAVLITGLPFPPLRDPRVILKKRYLQENRNKENKLLTGDEWYALEASRAVNQAIGRVIRHKNDYGAILLCDLRFRNERQKNLLSAWIQGHLNAPHQQSTSFGPLIRDISRFFRNAAETLPQPGLRPLTHEDISLNIKKEFINDEKPGPSFLAGSPAMRSFTAKEIKIEKTSNTSSFDLADYKKHEILGNKPKDFMSGLFQQSIDFNSSSTYKPPESTTNSLVTIHKRPSTSNELSDKKKKFKIIPSEQLYSSNNNTQTAKTTVTSGYFSELSQTLSKMSSQEKHHIPENRTEFLLLIKKSLSIGNYKILLNALNNYRHDEEFNKYYTTILPVFSAENFYILRGLNRFLKEKHREEFTKLTENLN